MVTVTAATTVTFLGVIALAALARWKRGKGGGVRVSRITQARIMTGKGRRSRFQDSLVPPVYCTAAARDHEAVAAALLQQDDVVLEIGCQLSTFTRMLSEHAKQVIGIDIDRKACMNTREMQKNAFYRKHSDSAAFHNVHLNLMEVWDLSELVHCAGHVRSRPG